MRDTPCFHVLAVIIALLALSPAAARSGTPGSQTVAVDDFGYLDTSDEPTDQAAAHQKRLQMFMARLRGDLGADVRFALVASPCGPACASAGPALAERLQAAAKDGAKILIIGNIQKTSTLVQWARAAAIDTVSNRVMFEKLFTFRGDSDEAWQRAESFVSEELRAGLAGAAPSPVPVAASPPVRLAVFPFELDDTSAAAETTGETAADTTGLAESTEAIRQLLAQSGRYQIVDIGPSAAGSAKSRALHDCGGCDASIARELGADQSLVGVIRRVSRTEYIVGFHLRDSRNGTVVADGDSGLRMGANYSWSRGATRLVRDRLLDGGEQH
jgi:hypothetical protein